MTTGNSCQLVSTLPNESILIENSLLFSGDFLQMIFDKSSFA